MHPNCHSVLHSIPDAVISLDKDGYILYVNPATTSLFNFFWKRTRRPAFSSSLSKRRDQIRIWIGTGSQKAGIFRLWLAPTKGRRSVLGRIPDLCDLWSARIGWLYLPVNRCVRQKKGRAWTVEKGGALSADGGRGKGLCHFSSGCQRPYLHLERGCPANKRIYGRWNYR